MYDDEIFAILFGIAVGGIGICLITLRLLGMV